MQDISESMAGRAAILQLLPFSLAETKKVNLLHGGFAEVLAPAQSSQPLVCLLFANVLGERCPGDYKRAGLGDISPFSRSSGESSRPDSEQNRPCCTPRDHRPHDWRLASHTRSDRPGYSRASVFRKLRKETH